MAIKFYTLQFIIPGDDTPNYALILNDETGPDVGFVIGEELEVRRAIDKLNRLLQSGQADDEVHYLDERLNSVRWLTVSQAAKEYDVPASTIRQAAISGKIFQAKKVSGRDGRGWRFPSRTFRYWLVKEYRPRNKGD